MKSKEKELESESQSMGVRHRDSHHRPHDFPVPGRPTRRTSFKVSVSCKVWGIQIVTSHFRIRQSYDIKVCEVNQLSPSQCKFNFFDLCMVCCIRISWRKAKNQRIRCYGMSFEWWFSNGWLKKTSLAEIQSCRQCRIDSSRQV